MRNVIKLSDVSNEIISELKKRKPFSENNRNFTIVGFGRIGVEEEVSDTVNIGGRNIPTVVVIELETGVVYQIALFNILPNLRKSGNEEAK